MKHRTAAFAQVGISYFFLTGFFVAAGLEASGIVKTSLTNELKDGLMLVMSFWFMRQRTTNDPDANTTTTTTISNSSTPPKDPLVKPPENP